jgi:hypothetical protein
MGEFQSGGAPPSELSAEPPLYVYKQFIVVLVLSAAAIVLVSPFTPTGGILWYLVIFTSLNLFNGLGQMLRMVSAVRKLRARVVPRGSGPVKVPKGGHAAVGSWDGGAGGEAEGACLLHVDDAPAWHHVFVIPNYKEDLAVLCATLDRLASHRYAPHYTILLAMEEKEANAEQKAAQLQEQYCLRFKAILFTLHSLDPVNEMPGKSSNVNAAVRQFSATVPAAERARYMLTIMDADALVPPAYVVQLEATAAAVGASAPDHIYAAPVMFEQNGHAVPSLVRVTDYTWGALAMQNLNNWSGVGFPISNYSLSLALAAAVDYWDTWWAGLGWAGLGWAGLGWGWACLPVRKVELLWVPHLWLWLRSLRSASQPRTGLAEMPCRRVRPSTTPRPHPHPRPRIHLGQPGRMPSARTCTCSSRPTLKPTALAGCTPSLRPSTWATWTPMASFPAASHATRR